MMKSVDMLRSYIESREGVLTPTMKGMLEAIEKENAVDIEREGRRRADNAVAHISEENREMAAFCDRLKEAAEAREDVELWGVEYMALPPDADGKAVHVDDMMLTEDGPFKVDGVGRNTFFYRDDHDNAGVMSWAVAGENAHYQSESISKILLDLMDFARTYDGKPVDADWFYEMVATAERLRLTKEIQS